METESCRCCVLAQMYVEICACLLSSQRGRLCQLYIASQLQTHTCLPCFVMIEIDCWLHVSFARLLDIILSWENPGGTLESRKSRERFFCLCVLFSMGLWKVDVKWTQQHAQQLNALCYLLKTPPSMFLHLRQLLLQFRSSILQQVSWSPPWQDALVVS